MLLERGWKRIHNEIHVARFEHAAEIMKAATAAPFRRIIPRYSRGRYWTSFDVDRFFEIFDLGEVNTKLTFGAFVTDDGAASLRKHVIWRKITEFVIGRCALDALAHITLGARTVRFLPDCAAAPQTNFIHMNAKTLERVDGLCLSASVSYRCHRLVHVSGEPLIHVLYVVRRNRKRIACRAALLCAARYGLCYRDIQAFLGGYLAKLSIKHWGH